MADLDWICRYPWRSAWRFTLFVVQSTILVAAQQVPTWAVDHDRRITIIETYHQIAHWAVPLVLLALMSVLGAITWMVRRVERKTEDTDAKVERIDGSCQHMSRILDRVTEVKVRGSDTSSAS